MWHSFLSLGIIYNYSYFFFLLIAILFGSFVFWKKAKEEHYDENSIVDLTINCLTYALIFGRLSFILINFETFGLHVGYWIAFWLKPGMYWLGSLVGLFLAVIITSRKEKWNTYQVFDLGVIGLALSNALINFGIFFSSSGQGIPTQLPIGVLFNNTFEARHPVGLYGGFLWLLAFIGLWILENRYRLFAWYQVNKGDAQAGFLLGTFLFFYGLIEVVLQLFSQNTGPDWLPWLNIGTGILFVILGISIILLRSGKIKETLTTLQTPKR